MKVDTPEPKPAKPKSKKIVPLDTKPKLIAALRKCFKISQFDLQKSLPAVENAKRKSVAKVKSQVATFDKKLKSDVEKKIEDEKIKEESDDS